MLRKLLLLTILIIAINASCEVIISEITFEGNTHFPDKVLEKIVSTKQGDPFNNDVLLADKQRLLEYYKKSNLHLVEIANPEIVPISNNTVTVIFKIRNEKSIIISNIEFVGNKYFSESKLKDKLHLKLPIELADLNDILKQTTDLYISRNYLFVQTKIDEMVSLNGTFKAIIRIDEGKPCHFKKFSFRGNKVTKDDILVKISGIRSNSSYSPDVLEQASENIRKKEYIRECNIFPIDESTLMFDIQEDKMTYLSGLAGYDNSEEAGSQFSGYINFKFLNLFGTDRNLHFNWESYPNDYSQLNLYYEDSGPINIPVGGNIELNRVEQDSTYIDSSVTSEIYYYNLKNRYGLEIGYNDIAAGSRRPITIEPEKQYSIGFFWRHSNVDYSLNPTTGMELDVRFRFTYVESDSLTSEREHTELSWHNYETITKNLVFMFGVNGNYVTDHDVEIYNQYRMGGFNSLRGFAEQRFNGYLTGWSNIELRYLLNRDSRMHLFFDYGVMQYKDVDEEKSQYNLIGTGLGLRLSTPVGILGIDYALGYDSNEWTSPMNGMLHFGLETKF